MFPELDPQPDPTPKRRSFRAWAFTRRTASVLVALMLVAAPAGASIIVQNYMEADITAAPPCFVKITGDDPTTSSQATFSADPLTDITAVDGVDLLEEKITVTGMTGDRVIYTDVVRYQNNCLEAIDVMLTGTVASGDWTNVAAEIWISNVVAPGDIDPNLEVLPADDWQDDHITIPANSAGAIADATGVVTVPAGSEIRGAFIVSSDVAFTGGTATANWVAQATINS